MSLFHPELSPRPKRNPHLRRPTVENAILGKLEYVNRDGAWWQGTTVIAGFPCRLDLEVSNSKITAATIESAAEVLSQAQASEAKIRDSIKLALQKGEYDAHEGVLKKHRLENPSVIDLIRPYMVDIVNNYADIRYECDALPEGHLFGAHAILASIDCSNKKVFGVTLFKSQPQCWATLFLEKSVPIELTGFENSFADQFIVYAASWGHIGIDRELNSLLSLAIKEVEEKRYRATGEAATYLKTVSRILAEVHKMANEAQ